MKTHPLALLALAAALTAGPAAYASERDQDIRDKAALDGTKMGLQQAIAAAEKQTGGQAVSADLQHERGTARFAVEVVGPQGVKTVLVDGLTGTVTAANDEEDDDD